MSKQHQSGRKQVLSDHYRQGKRLVPPILHDLQIVESSWVNSDLPEVLWIALIHDEFEPGHAIELCRSIAEAAYASQAEGQWPSLASASSYAAIPEAERERVVQALSDSRHITDIARALYPMAAYYPEFPMRFLCSHYEIAPNNDDLERLKRVVASVIPARGRSAIIVKATGVYITGITGRVLVPTDFEVPNLESVFDYPNSEESLQVGATVGAMLRFMLRGPDPEPSSWPTDFWNRSATIDPCQFTEVGDGQ